MKNMNYVSLIIGSVFVSVMANADPISMAINIGNYGFKLAQAGCVLPLIGSALYAKVDNKEKAKSYAMSTVWVAAIGFGGGGILSLLQGWAR